MLDSYYLVFNKANSFSFCSFGSFNCLIKSPATLRPPLCCTPDSQTEPSIGVPVELQIFNYLFQGTECECHKPTWTPSLIHPSAEYQQMVSVDSTWNSRISQQNILQILDLQNVEIQQTISYLIMWDILLWSNI